MDSDPSPGKKKMSASRSEQTSLVFANIKNSAHHAITKLKQIPNIESITPVTGRFDLVIKLKTNDPEKAFNTIEKIREIEDVTHTQTAFSMHQISNSSSREQEREQPIAFALMKVRGALNEALQKLKTITNCVEAHVIPGEFDLIASFRGRDPQEVLENSLPKIGNIHGITSSETLVAWNPPASEIRP